MGRALDNSQREEYLEWLLMDDRTRLDKGLPKTKTGYANLVDCSPRTLRRIENDPDFAAIREKREERIRRADPYETLEDAEELGIDDPEEVEYLQLKRRIHADALKGDDKARSLWMKHWGKEWVEEEAAQRRAGFADLTDDDLMVRTLELIGRDRVARWLADGS